MPERFSHPLTSEARWIGAALFALEAELLPKNASSREVEQRRSIAMRCVATALVYQRELEAIERELEHGPLPEEA